ncbi:MAG: hypothetical protein ACI9GZ_004573, partial [Bacteroidia bacterium]
MSNAIVSPAKLLKGLCHCHKFSLQQTRTTEEFYLKYDWHHSRIFLNDDLISNSP